MAPLNIAVIGTGVGGPAAAIGLARNGHSVTLYERASSIGGVGFAFRISPSSDQCLKFLGIDILAGGGVAAKWSRFMNYEGRLFAEIPENETPEEARKGLSAYVYRFLDEATKQGVQIKMGVEVASVDVVNSTISFADASTSSFDLIIGADGVYAIRNDPITSHVIDDKFLLTGWKGIGKLVVGYVVDYGTQFNLVCTHPEELSRRETSSGDDADKSSYNQKISLDTAKNIYKEFDKVVVRLLELADPGGFRVWKLLDMDDLPHWSKNRVVLIGDACHPVLPFGFAGASMAIEDAVTLTVLFPSGIELAQIKDRLRLFEHIRRKRVYRVRDESRKRSSGSKDAAGTTAYGQFLNNHDAVGEAEQALKEQQELEFAQVI
ncbi:FAD/NAD(P)-binding domain-containing protein [Hypoxylon sp. FL1150]|nr:FAD/NAD(P)-binding domain-containing protein [Hypoxylon sp. FL1150]